MPHILVHKNMSIVLCVHISSVAIDFKDNTIYFKDVCYYYVYICIHYRHIFVAIDGKDTFRPFPARMPNTSIYLEI